uniref:spermatogenesis-associated serine-rich protein 2-like n=1 Tax=Lonchura striata TaxID=40157 RepID=UPI00129333D3|nr:spermatogenesis-associated serine-rich protein 2-like [Lonchura striata domestica]
MFFSHFSLFFQVQAVRAVVPNRSNTEIVLVLQHFDNAVDRAVQAFMEGNASEVLKEWTVTGKKKNKKKKPKAKAPPGPGQEEKLENLEKNLEKNLGKLGISINGFHSNRCPSLESLPGLGNGISAFPAPAQPPTPARSDPGGRKMGCSLERSLKDLQRCSVALARFRALLREEVETSLRRVRVAFGEIQSCLMDREVALLAEMDKVKAEAMDLLSLRQRRAEALRALTEAAPAMSEEQLQELRADIKHFVSERKFDEELGRASGNSHCSQAHSGWEFRWEFPLELPEFPFLQHFVSERKFDEELGRHFVSERKFDEELGRASGNSHCSQAHSGWEFRWEFPLELPEFPFLQHFVSERKFDEELGRAGRFGCDLEGLRGSIGAFGTAGLPRSSRPRSARG